MKKICFITTSRADFGMIKIIVEEAIKFDKRLKIYLIISGNHNDIFFGKTIKEIRINKKVKIFKVFSNKRSIDLLSISKIFSELTKKFSSVLSKIRPNIFVVFGDRYEMLAATISAFILKIPITHIAGGEKTSGSQDDNFRHSITKFSNLHFPTSKEHKKRIVQLGENPNTIFNFGSLNRQKIAQNNFLPKSKLEKKYDFKFNKKNILMTFHPENLDRKRNVRNLKILLDCLNNLKDCTIVITSPNADSDGVYMAKIIKKYIKNKKKFKFITSLGSRAYVSLLKIVDGVIGNSSSGISEAPLFSINSINLGNRQKGREKTSSVISCRFNKKIIMKNLKKLKRTSSLIKFRKNDKSVAKKILKKIINFNFKKYENKEFRDIKFHL